MNAHGRARVGCSGWQYRDWRGIVYPKELPQREWFAYYASMFDTVELNSTFYRLPTPETASRWARAAPPGFVYASKLGAFGTHRMKLRDAASWLPNHVDRVQRLGAAAGPTLVQLPPRWRRNVERLDEFLSAAPRDLRWAVELREPSWIHDDVFATLERHGAALCIHDLLPRHPWVRTTNWTYVRFHGPDALHAKYQGLYGASRLRPRVRKLATWLADGTDIYAYFNNDYHGHAVNDARTLCDAMLHSGTTRKPPKSPSTKRRSTTVTREQAAASRRNVKKAAAVASRKRTGGSTPKTRAELYEEAKRRNLPGRSKMGRAELVRALGHQ